MNDRSILRLNVMLFTLVILAKNGLENRDKTQTHREFMPQNSLFEKILIYLMSNGASVCRSSVSKF